MKKQIISVKNEAQMHERARELFFSISGINNESRGYEKKIKEAERVQEIVLGKLDVRGMYLYCDNYEMDLSNDSLFIKNTALRCVAFKNIDKEQINGVFMFAVTAGDFALPNENLTAQVFADFWGTAYAEAARGIIKKELGEGKRLSDGFGPGYYGMDIQEMSKMAELIGFEQAGITMDDSYMLHPSKSCVELCFDVTEDFVNEKSRCAFCKGNEKMCKLCI